MFHGMEFYGFDYGIHCFKRKDVAVSGSLKNMDGALSVSTGLVSACDTPVDGTEMAVHEDERAG